MNAQGRRNFLFKADEELYHENRQTYAKLLAVFSKLDTSKENNYSLSREDFSSALVDCFKLKEPDAILGLAAAAETDLGVQGDEPFQYQRLFMEVSR